MYPPFVYPIWSINLRTFLVRWFKQLSSSNKFPVRINLPLSFSSEFLKIVLYKHSQNENQVKIHRCGGSVKNKMGIKTELL